MKHKKNGQKSWNFVISHGMLPILSLNCTKFIFLYFSAKTSGRQMVIENQEMVMEMSWTNICQFCGNPVERTEELAGR